MLICVCAYILLHNASSNRLPQHFTDFFFIILSHALLFEIIMKASGRGDHMAYEWSGHGDAEGYNPVGYSCYTLCLPVSAYLNFTEKLRALRLTRPTLLCTALSQAH